MRTLSHAKIIKTLFAIDSINDAAIYIGKAPGYALAKRLKMIESATEIALDQAEADYHRAWVADGLPGQPALLTPDNIDSVTEYLTNARGSWSASEALRKHCDI